MDRPLNWYGWSLETIAAVYETDAACDEAEELDGNEDYVYSACKAEMEEYAKDLKSVKD